MKESAKIEQKPWTRERRKSLRLVMSFWAEITDLRTRESLKARVANISLAGCFLDTVFPLAIGSRIRLTIRKELITFEVEGTVMYTQERVGMGVAFDELNADQYFALMILVSETHELQPTFWRDYF